jgi:hypothetical protein
MFGDFFSWRGMLVQKRDNLDLTVQQARAQKVLYLCREHAPMPFQCPFQWQYNFPKNIFVVVLNPLPTSHRKILIYVSEPKHCAS